MSDELKRDYQEKLGDKFGAIVNGVSYDWANGLVRLNEYRALFGDPANIEFINTFSGPFMSEVQQLFWRDLLLHITRLTDPVLCQNSALLKDHGCNLMHCKVLVSFCQHLMVEAPMRSV